MSLAGWALLAAVIFVDTAMLAFAALGVWALRRQGRRDRARAEDAYVWALTVVPAPDREELDYLADDFCEWAEHSETWVES